VLSPFKNLDHGDCHHDSDRDKYSQLDDHFAHTLTIAGLSWSGIGDRQRDPLLNLKKQD
jgi:hypothetical protein